MPPKVLNQYEIVRRLGAGGAGVVYLANDTKLRRPVVLKILRAAGSGDAARASILREARLASAVEHPNVCTVYEINESGGEAFIAMQYVPGRTLGEVVDGGALGLRLALSIGIQIADGLAAAHGLGIVHGDLKPANVMLTEGGLVKILDFGLARERPHEDTTVAPRPRAKRSGRDSSARFGTTAYMAPEQFVTGRSSIQGDVFAFGIILYEMATGRHPFVSNPEQLPFMQAGGAAGQIARAIQYFDPIEPHVLRADLPIELERVILKALEKQPANRFDSAAEVREALRTVARIIRLDAGVLPEGAPAAPVGSADAEKKTGLFSLLVERLIGADTSDAGQTSVVVLPFTSLGERDDVPFYGLALAEAVASRLTSIPSLVVRPSSSSIATAAARPDPADVGRRLLVSHVLSGNYLRRPDGFDLVWQLLDVRTNAVRTGGTISVKSFDLVAIQNEICDEVYASLRGTGHLQGGASSTEESSLSGEVWEDYLEARALLSNFVIHSSSRDDLDRARDAFRYVIARESSFAPAHSGLGIVFLEYARKGLAGLRSVIEAQRSFERARKIDPALLEAQLYNAYVFLWRGEKESACRSVQHLLQTASNSFDVRLVAATVLRLDGVYDSAREQLGAALRLNPSGATIVYNDRARIYHYNGQLDLATQEIEKGLTLEPRHPLLRTSLGYISFRRGRTERAIEILESVLLDDADLRILYPSLAICYAAQGEREHAAELITDEILASADADCEMAYRMATYFATTGETSEAVHWLRKAIYLGNENYPWLSRNPAWERLREDEHFVRTLAELKKAYRTNVKTWKRLLPGV